MKSSLTKKIHPFIDLFSTGEKEIVIPEREAYAFTSGIALGTVLFKVQNFPSYL